MVTAAASDMGSTNISELKFGQSDVLRHQQYRAETLTEPRGKQRYFKEQCQRNWQTELNRRFITAGSGFAVPFSLRISRSSGRV